MDESKAGIAPTLHEIHATKLKKQIDFSDSELSVKENILSFFTCDIFLMLSANHRNLGTPEQHLEN